MREPRLRQNELSFKETVVPVKVAPDQDSITASFPFTNTSGTPVTISKIHVSCDCTTAGAKDNKLTYAPGESGVISAVMKTGNFSGTVDKDMTVHANGSAYKLVIARRSRTSSEWNPASWNGPEERPPCPKP